MSVSSRVLYLMQINILQVFLPVPDDFRCFRRRQLWKDYTYNFVVKLQLVEDGDPG